MTTSGFQCTLEVMYDRNVKLPEWREGEGVMTCDRDKGVLSSHVTDSHA